MPLVGPLGAVVFAFLGACACEILGNQRTRGFTRFGFGVVALRSMGFTLTGLASFGADVWGVLPL